MQKARGLKNRGLFVHLIWRRPTFEGPCGPTIIGAGGLNCRVRDGNGWDPAAMSARNLIPPSRRAGAPGGDEGKLHTEELSVPDRGRRVKNFRAISTGQLHPLRDFHLRPINVVVYHDPSHLRDRDLILESVSRLYAFSVYLVRT